MRQYIHNTPGRLRVKTGFIKNNEETAKHIKKFIDQIRGVSSVATNTITGSITILYDTKITKSITVLDILKDMGLLNEQHITQQHVGKTATKVGEFVGKFLLGLVVEKTFGYNFLSFVITSIIFF
jgi:copper chaperone CopZ